MPSMYSQLDENSRQMTYGVNWRMDESPFTHPHRFGDSRLCRLESPASSLKGLRNRTLGEGLLEAGCWLPS